MECACLVGARACGRTRLRAQCASVSARMRRCVGAWVRRERQVRRARCGARPVGLRLGAVFCNDRIDGAVA
eukprot:4544434-Pleurochrysis_carterae.AAC.1